VEHSVEHRKARQAIADVDEACRTPSTPTALHRTVAAAVSPAVPFDRWCGLTTDPTTALPTGGYHEEGLPLRLMPRLLELEYGGQADAARLLDLARADRPVAVLSAATGRDPTRSARYRDVLAPAGLPHELRVVHRSGNAPRGALILLRGSDVRDFTASEAALLESMAGRVAEALRRMLIVEQASQPASSDGPGVLLLGLTERAVFVRSGTPSARRWLTGIEDETVDGVPFTVASLARTAAGRAGPARCRLRLRSGRWLTLHAEPISASTVSVVVEPSPPADVAALLSDAYRLTAREVEVVALAVRGYSNAEIARMLWLSPYTIADHLKSVFDKTGVHSRGELTSLLLFDQYRPRREPAPR